MFDRFVRRFNVDSRATGDAPALPITLLNVTGYAEFMEEFSGCTFNRGMYRVHTSASAEAATPLVLYEFPSYRDRMTLFGYDWIGRQFALDSAKSERDEPAVLIFEADTGQAWEVPANFRDLHEVEFIDYPGQALASELLDEWVETNRSALPLERDQCVGFKVPLFLGGDNTAADMELTNIEVHWSLCGQLWRQAKHWPSGTTIGSVEAE